MNEDKTPSIEISPKKLLAFFSTSISPKNMLSNDQSSIRVDTGVGTITLPYSDLVEAGFVFVVNTKRTMIIGPAISPDELSGFEKFIVTEDNRIYPIWFDMAGTPVVKHYSRLAKTIDNIKCAVSLADIYLFSQYFTYNDYQAKAIVGYNEILDYAWRTEDAFFIDYILPKLLSRPVRVYYSEPHLSSVIFGREHGVLMPHTTLVANEKVVGYYRFPTEDSLVLADQPQLVSNDIKDIEVKIEANRLRITNTATYHSEVYVDVAFPHKIDWASIAEQVKSTISGCFCVSRKINWYSAQRHPRSTAKLYVDLCGYTLLASITS